MMGALASFTAMALSARELSAEVSIFQISLFRNAICLMVLVPLAMWWGWSSVRTTKPWLHVARNTIHYGGVFGWIYGLSVLPLAAVFSLEFTVPIWTALLATLLLRERLNVYRVAAIGFGFIGILVILRPGSELFQLASFAVIGAAFCYASTYVFTRHMSTTESPFVILFYMNLVQLPISLIPSVPQWVTPSVHLWPWVLVMGISGLGSHYSVARAMKLADATVVAPLDFLRLPLSAVVAFWIYAEPFNPFVLLGGAIIFGGNLLNIWGERRKKG